MRPIPSLELVDLVVEVLAAAGADPGEAATVADVLVWADRRTNHPQGVVWLDVLSQRLLAGDIVSPAPLAIDQRAPALSVLDGGGGLGHVAADEALRLVAQQAQEFGIAACSVRNSSHFGPCGYYALCLAEHNLVGVVASNAFPKVAAHGSRSAVLGTNPLGFAAPAGAGLPIVGDLSTGALAGSRVREAKASGQQLEPGMALDRHGDPTRDPSALDAGGVMLPVGGPKGFALGLLVEVLTSVLSGGALPDESGSMFAPGPAGTSHFVLAISAGDHAGARIDHLRSLVMGAERRDGFDVRLPGDRGHEAERFDSDIVLPPDSAAAIRRAAERVGVQVAW